VQYETRWQKLQEECQTEKAFRDKTLQASLKPIQEENTRLKGNITKYLDEIDRLTTKLAEAQNANGEMI
jgi:predicted  nucleic acid-binding Zn-ribbon protein